MPQLPGFIREKDENGLRNFLRVMRVADLPERNAINQVNVPRNQCGESFLGIITGVLAQQRAVVR